MWIVSFEESGALSLSAADQKSKEDITTVNIINFFKDVCLF